MHYYTYVTHINGEKHNSRVWEPTSKDGSPGGREALTSSICVVSSEEYSHNVRSGHDQRRGSPWPTQLANDVITLVPDGDLVGPTVWIHCQLQTAERQPNNLEI